AEQAVDVSCLRRRQVPESLHTEPGNRYRHGAAKPLGHVAGEESRLITTPLFESKKEKRTIAVEWTTQGEAILSAPEIGFFDRRKRIARLETLVPNEAKNVAM